MASRAAAAADGTVRGQFALLVAAALSMACGIITSMIVARAAGAAEFGFFALVATLLPIARDMTDLGTANVAARRIARSPDEEKEALSDLLAWRRMPAAIAAVGLALLAIDQGETRHELLLFGAALCALLYVNAGFVAVFQARKRLEIPAAITSVTQVATVAACTILAAVSAPPILFAVTIVLREAIAALLLRVLAIRSFDCRPSARALAGPLRLRLGELGTIGLASLSYQLAIASGAVLVSLFSSELELGWYGAAFRLAAPLFALGWILASPWVPRFATEADRGVLERATEVPLLVAAATAGFLFAFAGSVIQTLFGNAFEPAMPILKILMIAAAANVGGAFMATGLIATGKDRTALWLGLGTLAITLALSPPLLFGFGPIGAAWALAAALTVSALVAGIAALGPLRWVALLAKTVAVGIAVALVGEAVAGLGNG